MKKLNKILLVEDDPTTIYINENILKNLNITHNIEVLTDGKQALEYIREHCTSGEKSCPALIILDYHMPVMNGLELMKALKEEGILSQADIVFLLLAIHTTAEEQEAFKDLGVQEFTTKPLSKQIVLDAYTKYWAGDTAGKHTSA